MTDILVNGLSLTDQFTGVQYYVENLLNAMQGIVSPARIHYLVSDQYQGKVKTTDSVKLLPAAVDSRSRLKRIFFENFRLGTVINQKSRHLFHSPSYVLPFYPPLPSIVTVHDLIAIEYPQFSKNETVLYHALFQKRSLQRASKIIAVSDVVKHAIIRNYDIPEQKIAVIYHGVNRVFRRVEDPTLLAKITHQYNLPSQYILFVGNIEPKKNLERLLKAFHLLKCDAGLVHKLVIVGKIGWKCESVFAEIGRLKLEKEVLFLGYVTESDLPSLYSLADLFVFPSLYEGFGIPPLEAMACGTPLLVSSGGALPEVTGNVCMQVDPLNVKAMAEKIYLVLHEKDLQSSTVAAGKKRVRQFTWPRAAAQTLEIYEETIQSLNTRKVGL